MNKVKVSYFRLPFFSLITYFLAGVLFFLFSCDSAQERKSKVMTYYDVKGFVESQISFLEKEKPEVIKTMHVSGKNEMLATRDVDWKKELELFVQADINKPAYSKSYKISKPDSLTVLYELKEGESLPVRHLKIFMEPISGTPLMIHALLLSENKLYKSEKNIEMKGSVEGGHWHLNTYSIQGYQKLAMMDEKTFNVTARVHR